MTVTRSASLFDRALGEMHRDRPSTAARPLYFHVVDPAQLSHTGLEHRKFGHQSYAQLNVTRLALGLPMLKVPLKGYKCAICALANSRTLGISGCGKRIHGHS